MIRLLFCLLVSAGLGLFSAASAQTAPQAASIQAPGTLRGTVVDAQTGEALVGAAVSTTVRGNLRGAVTDIDGRFRLLLPQGTHTLLVRFLGYDEARVPVRLQSGQEETVQITLAAGALEIEGVEVMAARGDSYARQPGSATQIQAREVELIQPIGTQELLENIPGVYAAPDDGFGNGRLSIGIRGLNPRRASRVLVLEDGIPIQPALYVYPNMYYNPPVERVDQVEVIKGSGAIRYGPQTMGGVINYVTSRPRASLGGEGQIATGENGYLSLFGEVGGFGSRRLKPEVQVLFKRGDGYRDNNSFYQANVTGKLNVLAGPQRALFVKANLNTERYGATYTGLTEFSFDQDPTFNPKRDDQFDVRRAALDFIYNREQSAYVSSVTRTYLNVFDRRWWRENDVFIRASDLDAYREDPSSVGFVNPLDPADKVRVGNGRNNFGILRTFYVAGIEQAYTLNHSLLGKGASLEAGARLHIERFIDDRVIGDSPGDRSGDFLTTRPDETTADPDDVIVEVKEAGGVRAKSQRYETAALSFFASEKVTLGGLEVTPGVRFEVFEQSRVDRLNGSRLEDKTTAVLLPGLGFNYALPGEASHLYGGVHRGYTPPSSGALTLFNADGLVEAEKSWNVEAGARGAFPLLSFDASAFFLYLQDLAAPARGTVIRDASGALNLGSARTFGLESAVTLNGSRYGFLPDLSVNYTLLETEILDASVRSAVLTNTPAVDVSGNELPYAPRHTLGVALSRTLGPATARVDVRHVSSVFTDYENLGFTTGRGDTGPVPSYTLLGGSLQYALRSGVQLQLTVKNALDEVYVGSRLHSNPTQITANQSSGILPGARRQINLSVRYRF